MVGGKLGLQVLIIVTRQTIIYLLIFLNLFDYMQLFIYTLTEPITANQHFNINGALLYYLPSLLLVIVRKI